MKFGSEVHALLEGVSWIDESPPVFPECEAAHVVTGLLENPAVRELFERKGLAIDLFREQPADAILDGALLTGVIDRLHLHRDAAGHVWRVDVIDFKTDAVKEPDELIERYQTQMDAYRSVIARIYPDAEIRCLLLSVRHGQMVLV